MEAVLKANATAGLPAIDVSPLQAHVLALLCHVVKARHVLEVGTLGGYSTIAMARALAEGGQVLTIEADPRHAEVARANFARADVVARVDLRVGKALDVLPGLVDEGHAFDLAFIDADKENNAAYADWAATLVRPNGLVIVDNVVRGGRIIDDADVSPQVVGTRSLYAAMRMDRRFEVTALQTVGVKGWDGLMLARRV
jgi:predicted O-methyltransferase YrrM